MSDTGTTSPKLRIAEAYRPDDITGTPPLDRTEVMSKSDGPRLTQGNLALAPVIQIDRLYDAHAGISSQVVQALELLGEASELLAEASRSDNPVQADVAVQRFQMSLPKLFARRSIGDGFAVVVNALHFAFSNRRGVPLTGPQLNGVWRVLRELRTRPAMQLEQGIQRVEELENLGLEVDPPEIAHLLEDAESAENG